MRVALAAVFLAGCFTPEPPPELRVTAEASWCPESCAPLELPVGFGGEVWAKFHYEDGLVSPATDTTWTWDPTSAIDLPDAGANFEQATVLGIAAGRARVTVRNDQFDIEDGVDIVVLELRSVAIEPADLELDVGGTAALVAMGSYEGGDAYDLAGSVAGSAEWTSDAPEVAVVEAGVVTGVAPGQATITALFEDATGSTTLTVGE